MPRPRRRALLVFTLAPALALAPARTTRRPSTQLHAATLGPPRVKASGYARKLAKDFGVDLHSVTGTGPGGRIVARDVEGAKGSNWVATPGATTATPKAQKLAKKNASLPPVKLPLDANGAQEARLERWNFRPHCPPP